MSAIRTFTEKDFRSLCDKLAEKDPDLQLILNKYSYPPCWKRAPSFETLVHIILEQQVSLASAMAAMKKLKERIGAVTPAAVDALSDEELRACYFSRQKIGYTRYLAHAVMNKGLNIEELSGMDDDAVRINLTKMKGIGNWTVDVYLMMVLQRSDLFPLGDVALMTSLRETKNLSKGISVEDIRAIAAKWKPYQTIAAYMLWHAYLCKRKR